MVILSEKFWFVCMVKELKFSSIGKKFRPLSASPSMASGPRPLGRFSTGRVEEFIRARTLSAADLRDPEISALIASKMREFHSLHMPGPMKVQLWQRMRLMLEAKDGLQHLQQCTDLQISLADHAKHHYI